MSTIVKYTRTTTSKGEREGRREKEEGGKEEGKNKGRRKGRGKNKTREVGWRKEESKGGTKR